MFHRALKHREVIVRAVVMKRADAFLKLDQHGRGSFHWIAPQRRKLVPTWMCRVKWCELSGVKWHDDHLLCRVSKHSSKDRPTEAACDRDDQPLTPTLI